MSDADLRARLDKIEEFMEDGVKFREEMRTMVFKMGYKIYGNDDTHPRTPGIDERVEILEADKKDRFDVKRGFLKIAVGAITMSVGAAVLWIFTVVKEAFIKH